MNRLFFALKFKKNNASSCRRGVFICLLAIIVNCFDISLVSCQSYKYKILITGFEPFGGYKNNPSQDLVKFINSHNKEFEDCIVKGIVLPVTYFESWEILNQNINTFEPNIVISFGYSPSSKGIRIESIAKNYDGGFYDNSGKSHYGAIIPNGPLRYSNGLPIEKINNTLIKNDFLSFISNDAGAYICNHIFYNLMHYGERVPKMKAGFIHIPSWAIEGKKGLFEALKTIIQAIKDNSTYN